MSWGVEPETRNRRMVVCAQHNNAEHSTGCCSKQTAILSLCLAARNTIAYHCFAAALHGVLWLCRYDLQCVDAVEAFAAEGLAVFGGRLPDGAATKQLQELVLAALRTNLGYRGARVCVGLVRDGLVLILCAQQPMINMLDATKQCVCVWLCWCRWSACTPVHQPRRLPRGSPGHSCRGSAHAPRAAQCGGGSASDGWVAQGV